MHIKCSYGGPWRMLFMIATAWTVAQACNKTDDVSIVTVPAPTGLNGTCGLRDCSLTWDTVESASVTVRFQLTLLFRS
jgi:hypothetical protein